MRSQRVGEFHDLILTYCCGTQFFYLGMNSEFDLLLLTQSIRDIHQQTSVCGQVHTCSPCLHKEGRGGGMAHRVHIIMVSIPPMQSVTHIPLTLAPHLAAEQYAPHWSPKKGTNCKTCPLCIQQAVIFSLPSCFTRRTTCFFLLPSNRIQFNGQP